MVSLFNISQILGLSVKVLSIRDSLPHLRSIVLYGEDEVPSDAKVNYNVHHLISQNG